MSTGKEYRKLDDNFSIRDVGSTLLDHLAKGLYPADEVLREYIQNAIDAHRLWRYETGTETDGPIQIEVRDGRLSLIDYGVGMFEDEVRRVKSIAVTSKVDAKVALTGHKGVGIWAGLSYFETLILDTTRRGSNEGYRLTIHFKRIVDGISDRADIGEVMEGNYIIEAYDIDKDLHYTEVTLVNPTRSSEWFTSIDRVKDAVRRICPCEVDPNFSLYQTLMEWYHQHDIELYPIVVDGMNIYRSYPSSVESFKNISITINDVEVAQGWQAVHTESEKFTPTHDELTGFRLIQSGFTLGGDNPYGTIKFPNHKQLNTATATYLAWHIGEIHITSRTLRPNLQRNQLEESEEARQFIQRLRDFYLKIEDQGRTLSEKRREAKKTQEEIRDKIKQYKQYEEQINSILNREILVALTQNDNTILTSIQRSLIGDDQMAEHSTDAKDSKKSTKANFHLRDKDVRAMRKKLFTKLQLLVVKVESVSNSSINSSFEQSVKPMPASTFNDRQNNAGVKAVTDTVSPRSVTYDLTQEVQVGNNSVTENSDLVASPSKEATLAANETEMNDTLEPEFFSSTAKSYEKEATGTDANSASQEKVLDSSSRKIPVAVVLGLLEQALNEELPKNSDIKSAIVNKMKERIDWTLSNVE